VGVEQVREFHSVMAARKLHEGAFATSSTFTDDARQFANDNGISTLDGRELLDLISRRAPAEQQSLLAIAYQGETW
jgi:restriction system protein